MNFVGATLTARRVPISISSSADTRSSSADKNKDNALDAYADKEVVFGIRPEDVHDEPEFIAKGFRGYCRREG